MKFAHNIALLALAALPLVSHAEIVTYNFSADVAGIYMAQSTPTGYVYNYVASSDFAGASVSMGDHVTGHITYDTSIPALPFIPASSGSQMYSGAVQQFEFKFQQSGLSYKFDSTGYSDIMTSINPTPYTFGSVGFSTLSNTPQSSTFSMLNFIDPSSKAPASLDIPSQLALSDFPLAQLTYTYQVGDTSVNVSAGLNSLTKVSAVPEPNQWMMLAAGALLLVGVSRRAQRRS